MGRFADDVQARLHDELAAARPALDWTVEHEVGATPVDVAGEVADLLWVGETVIGPPSADQ